VPRSRTRGAIPSLPNTPSWRGALYLYFTFNNDYNITNNNINGGGVIMMDLIIEMLILIKITIVTIAVM
jgi:hypothetical protein